MELLKIRSLQPFKWILAPNSIKIFVEGIVDKVVGVREMAFWNMVS